MNCVLCVIPKPIPKSLQGQGENMLNDLKKEITDCYMYGEIICQQGFGPKTDISMHDMIRFDLLQF